MLVQLADGRSFGFPDDMDDVQVDRFIQALLAAEKSAAALDAGTPDFGAPLLSEVQFPAPAPETPAAFVPDVYVMQAYDRKRKSKRKRAFLLLG